MKQSKNSLAVHQLGVIPVLGIDVSKLTLDACMITADSILHPRVRNERDGHQQLHAWAVAISPVYWPCLESTGSYGEAVAKYLFSQQVAVSLVNPAQTAAFAKAQLLRTKTDKVDAESIGRFARAMLLEGQLPCYESRSEEDDALQELDSSEYPIAFVSISLGLTCLDRPSAATERFTLYGFLASSTEFHYICLWEACLLREFVTRLGPPAVVKLGDFCI